MSGYCSKCGNQHCICDIIEAEKKSGKRFITPDIILLAEVRLILAECLFIYKDYKIDDFVVNEILKVYDKKIKDRCISRNEIINKDALI